MLMTVHDTTRRHHLWLALLIVGSVGLSLGFACATPFAAFAALAALTLPRNEALLAAGGVWFANQAVGFLFLHYPWTTNCLSWGVVLGLAIVIAALAARAAAARLRFAGTIAAGAGGFVAAFAAHQLFSLAVAATLLGGTEDFTPAIVADILATNATAFIGLLALSWLADRIGLIDAPVSRLRAEV
jgi:hypothetical protein